MTLSTWLRPTVRTLRLAPLLGTAVGTAIAWALAAAATGDVPAELAMLGCGVIAAGVPLALDDQAHTLLAALPTSERARLLRRLASAGLITLAAWLLASGLAGHLADPLVRLPDTAALIALTAAGVAGLALTQSRRHAVAATTGAAIPLAWTAGRWFMPESLTDVADLWLDHPLPVAAAALTLILIGARR